jgi:hypothetical protein
VQKVDRSDDATISVGCRRQGRAIANGAILGLDWNTTLVESLSMSEMSSPSPLHFLLLLFSGWVNRHQNQVIEYLMVENRILRDQRAGRRLRLTDRERRRLAVKGRVLGRKVLRDVATVVTPDTIFRWYRRLIARKYGGSKNRGRGRPSTATDITELVVRMARENPGWGYTRIRDALRHLGHEIARNTVKRILLDNGIEPPPTQTEVDALAKTLARRISKLMKKHANSAPDDALLERCAAQPAKPVRRPTPAPSHGKRPALLGACDGFQVHASTCVPPNAPDQLERLLRYFGRPALPRGRIERRIDGPPFSNHSVFTLKRPRRGVTEFLFDPVAFLARIASLIPRPMSNQIRTFGFYSAASSLREYVLAVPPDATPTRPVAPERPKRMAWADLLQQLVLRDWSSKTS